jgi:hypothetical protein
MYEKKITSQITKLNWINWKDNKNMLKL